MSSISIGSLDKELYFGPTFLRGIIYVISVAIFITIFELCFFTIHIAPLEHDNIKTKIHEAKNTSIDQTKQNIDETVDETVKSIGSINDIIDSIGMKNQTLSKELHAQSFIDTITERELTLNYKINNDAIFFICLEIFIFILIIVMVCQKLSTYVTTDKQLNIGYNTYYGMGILPPIINSLLTTVVLIIFQINMYFFAHKWLYTSDYEIDYEITKNLDKYLN